MWCNPTYLTVLCRKERSGRLGTPECKLLSNLCGGNVPSPGHSNLRQGEVVHRLAGVVVADEVTGGGVANCSSDSLAGPAPAIIASIQ